MYHPLRRRPDRGGEGVLEADLLRTGPGVGTGVSGVLSGLEDDLGPQGYDWTGTGVQGGVPVKDIEAEEITD